MKGRLFMLWCCWGRLYELTDPVSVGAGIQRAELKLSIYEMAEAEGGGVAKPKSRSPKPAAAVLWDDDGMEECPGGWY